MKFIQILPIEETYLRIFDKPPKVSLTRQIISFNYGSLSPYSSGGHLSCQSADSIFVWYFKQPLLSGMTIYIPEAYLVWRFFKDRTNALILMPRKGLLSIMVIQNGSLRAQVTHAAGEGEAQFLDLIKREYSLHNVEVIRLEPTVRFVVSPRDLLTFVDLKLDKTRIMEQSVALVKGPLIAVLLITSGIYLYQESRLESLYAEKKGHLAQLKRENGDLQTSLEEVREKTSYWNDFIAKKQAYPDYYQTLSRLAEVVQRHGGYINMVEYSENRFTVGVGVKSSESLVMKDLLATGLFQEVKLLSATKDISKPDIFIYSLTMVLNSKTSKTSKAVS
jgi:hypothetical protein